MATDQIPLRQRKKERARHAIQQSALDLIEAQGYTNTTVEQIAAAAEVSPSTIYRYFKTKEQIVYWDRWDPVIVAALKSRPPGEQPIESLRAAIAAIFPKFVAIDANVMWRRLAVIQREPELRLHMDEHFSEGVDLAVRVLAERTNRDESDLELRVVVQTFVAALVVALTAWGRDGGDLTELAQRAMSIVASGARLPEPPP